MPAPAGQLYGFDDVFDGANQPRRTTVRWITDGTRTHALLSAYPRVLTVVPSLHMPPQRATRTDSRRSSATATFTCKSCQTRRSVSSSTAASSARYRPAARAHGGRTRVDTNAALRAQPSTGEALAFFDYWISPDRTTVLYAANYKKARWLAQSPIGDALLTSLGGWVSFCWVGGGNRCGGTRTRPTTIQRLSLAAW
jgi:hypothetical protein